MLLSFHHHFVFLRARKVAGTSVEIALSTICGPDDIVPPMIAVDERIRQDMGGRSGNYGDPFEERAFAEAIRRATPDTLPHVPPPVTRYGPHMSLAAVEAAYGASLDGFDLICVERNPYAKVISALHMQRNAAGYRSGTAADLAAPVENLAADLDRVIERGRLQALKSIAMYGGRRARVLRYESVVEDLAALAHDLGVQPPPLPHAKRGPLSNGVDPLAVFRRDQIDHLNAVFAEEFAAFGYVPR